MNVSDVEAAIEEIRSEGSDYEKAHGMEDSLYVEVLQAIADGASNSHELARAVLKTKKMSFDRHCA
jgi:hypothetical protein